MFCGSLLKLVKRLDKGDFRHSVMVGVEDKIDVGDGLGSGEKTQGREGDFLFFRLKQMEFG